MTGPDPFRHVICPPVAIVTDLPPLGPHEVIACPYCSEPMLVNRFNRETIRRGHALNIICTSCLLIQRAVRAL